MGKAWVEDMVKDVRAEVEVDEENACGAAGGWG